MSMDEAVAREAATRRSRIALLLPVWFVVLVGCCMVSALHAPRPHDLPLAISGPAAAVQRVEASLDRTSPGYDVSDLGSTAAVREAVLRRDAVAGVDVTTGGGATRLAVSTASAAGRVAAQAVRTDTARVAAELGATVTDTDLAPLVPEDAAGSGVFYLVLFTGFGGLLTAVVATAVLPRSPLRVLVALVVAGGAVDAVAVFGLASIFLGGLETDFGQLAAVLGVLALYGATAGLVALLAWLLVGRAAVFLSAPIILFLNVGSSGGPVPESMLPGFWQALHAVWFGAGAVEAVRDVVYFPAADPVRWILQLAAWTAVLLLLAAGITGLRSISRLEHTALELAGLEATPGRRRALRSLPDREPLVAPDAGRRMDPPPIDADRSDAGRVADLEDVTA